MLMLARRRIHDPGESLVRLHGAGSVAVAAQPIPVECSAMPLQPVW